MFRDIVSPRYEVKGLTPGLMYRFRISAIGLHADSTWSAEIVSGAQYPTPVMRDASPALIRSIDLGWNWVSVEILDLPNAVSYHLLVRTGGELVREIGYVGIEDFVKICKIVDLLYKHYCLTLSNSFSLSQILYKVNYFTSTIHSLLPWLNGLCTSRFTFYTVRPTSYCCTCTLSTYC